MADCSASFRATIFVGSPPIVVWCDVAYPSPTWLETLALFDAADAGTPGTIEPLARFMVELVTFPQVLELGDPERLMTADIRTGVELFDWLPRDDDRNALDSIVGQMIALAAEAVRRTRRVAAT